MKQENEYQPAKIWQWNSENGGRFAKINRPISGATHDKELAIGEHPFQLYSLATPNGVKITVMFEELLALGIDEAQYDAWFINIGEGEQFSNGFVEINPNSKIPALVDRSGKTPLRVFESGSILLHLAEKFNQFLPSDLANRTEVLNWLFWQMGSAPYLGGGFGHFYSYAPIKIEYCIDRFTMEVKRQFDVLDKQLANNEFIAGDEYSIADIAIWPWYGGVMLNTVYEAAEFLQAHEYTHLMRWTKQIADRPAVQRGIMVNRAWGAPEGQLRERHDASDFELRTQDKLEPDAEDSGL